MMRDLQAEIEQLRRELAETKERLQEAENTLQAIQAGEVDALVVNTSEGDRIFTLQGADHTYQRLVEQMGEGAAIVSDDSLILYSNQRFAQLLNRPLKKIIGSDLTSFVTSRDRQVLLQLLKQDQREDQFIQEVSLMSATLNPEIPVQVSIKKCQLDGITVNTLVITDVTESKIKEAVKLNRVLNSAIAALINYRTFPDQTWILDYCSEGSERILGYTPAALVADPSLWMNNVYQDDLDLFCKQLIPDEPLEQNSWIEYRYSHPDGILLWIAASYFVEWDEINQAWNSSVILIDITKQKQAEIALQEQIAQEQIVNQITQNIRQTLNLDQILQTTVDQVREFLKADRVIIFQFQPDWTGKVITESVLPDSPTILSAQIYDPCFTEKYIEIYRQVSFTTRTDFAAEDLEPCYRELMKPFEVQANLVMPLLPGNQLWGLLIVHQSSAPRQWQLGETELLQKLGVQVSIAIQQAELFAQTRQELLERQKAQQALLVSENRLKGICKFAPVVLIILDLNNRHLLVSDYYAKILETTPEQLLNKSIYDVWTPEEADFFAKMNRQVIETQQPVSVEEIAFHPDPHTYLSLKFPLYDAEEKIYAICIFATDITERKNTQQKLAEQAALLDIATDAIFVQDLDNHILFWNQGAERFYGWTEAEVLGQKTQDLFNQGLELTAAIQTMIQEGHWQGELEQVTKTGNKVIVESHHTLVENLFSQPQSILVVNSNITDKKELEKQFYHAQRLESLGTLASGIAHDFNNILTPIVGVSQLLPLYISNADDKIETMFRLLLNSAKRGTELVKRILLFSRNAESEFVALNIKDLILEVVNIAQQTFPKSIIIQIDLPSDPLWTISADVIQIHQVLMNLMINAKDAMSEQGTLTISGKNFQLDQHYALMNLEAQEGPYVVVTVLDTGSGIPPELIERIFDPFFTTKGVGKGTGLGLSTVRGIIKNHGGFLKVYSELNKGTRFEIFFPAIEAPVKSLDSEDEIVKGHGQLILIVDDELSIQEVIKASLEEYNYRVIVANDGVEAIAVYAQKAQEISVVLMDIMMPNLDGMTAIRALKSINSQVKIIASSGLLANKKMALEANVHHFLLKPYTIQQLLQVFREVLLTDGDQEEGIYHLFPQTETSLSKRQLSKDSLAMMSSEWTQQVYEAAYYCDSDLLLELVEQIPSEYREIREALKDLILNFEIDKIMELAEIQG